MRIGLLAPMFGQLCEPKLLRDFAQASEEYGFESLWVGDHIALPSSSESTYAYVRSQRYSTERGEQKRADRWDAVGALSFLAGITTRMTLGTSVYLAPYRHPLVSAKAFSSLDVMSGGRLEVGVGVGWLAEEFSALGVPFSERGARTDEVLEIWRKAWTGQPISHEGRFFQIEDVAMEPVPVRGHVPLAFGGHSKPTFRRILNNRGAWHAVTESPEHCFGWDASFPRAIEQLREAWDQRYADGTVPEITGVIIDGEASDPDNLATMCEQYEELGVTRLILDFPAARSTDGDSLMKMVDRLASVLPLEAA